MDIGNTGLGYGIFEGEKLLSTWRMATSISRTPDEYAALLFPPFTARRLQKFGYLGRLLVFGSSRL